MSIERKEFSVRLQQALVACGYETLSPTRLTREFNTRYHGRQVTVHAVRKWLLGESIPVQDKLRLLAAWLKVDVTWLRYGDESQQHAGFDAQSLVNSHQDLQLIEDLQLLDDHHRQIAQQVVRALLHLNARKNAV